MNAGKVLVVLGLLFMGSWLALGGVEGISYTKVTGDSHSVVLAARRSSCGQSHSPRRSSKVRRSRSGKLRYNPGHYRKYPGYYVDFGCHVIYVPERKVWVPGYYY